MTARWQQRIVVETAFSVTWRSSLVSQYVAFVFSLRRTSRSKRNCVARRFYFEDQSRIDAVCREIRKAKFLELTLWGHARQSLVTRLHQAPRKILRCTHRPAGIGGRLRNSAAGFAATNLTRSCVGLFFIRAMRRGR